MVPFVDLKRLEDGFIERWSEASNTLSRDAKFIGGDEVVRLESRLQQYSEVNHVVTCANGTDALQVSLRALGVEPGDKVLIPNMTFWATFEAVVNVGAVAVTIDINPVDGGVDVPSFCEAVLKEKPKAAILAHLYGWASEELTELREFADKNGVYLVEDGAQCLGTIFDNAPIFKEGLIATTSFYPAKVLGAAGDGGAIFTNDANLARAARTLTNHGRSSHYSYDMVGWNSRLDALQAAYLNISLDYLPARIESRLSTVDFYSKLLGAIGLDNMNEPINYRQNGYCNVCLVSDKTLKARLESELLKKRIGFSNIYPETISQQSVSRKRIIGHYGANFAETHCKSVINLPIFPYMKKEELEYIKLFLTNFFLEV